MANWTAEQIPDQTGRTVLVTGANSGLGLQAAHELAGRGARVLIAARSRERGEAAVTAVTVDSPPGSAELVELDLADLASVRRAAKQVRESTGDALDVLVNNAGVMGTPRRRTADGFELQIGTNHLGHAALTWLLMPALRTRPGARVVTVSSFAHRGGGLELDDLNFERRHYDPATAYSASKLANLLFAFELDRRARAAGLDLVSVAAHPGLTDTELALNTMRMRGSWLLETAARAGNKIFAQRVGTGALPQLYAATAPDVRGGDYYGPRGPGEIRGHPKRVRTHPAAQDPALARRLWEVTAQATGVDPEPA